MAIKALKVSEVNNYIKRLVLNDMVLSNLSLEGEISNFKLHYSGHMYFNLKDDKSKLKSIMFKGDASSLDFIPEDGKKVIAKGYISVYEKEGDYQFYVKEMKEEGLGDLHIAFENLKKKLEKEGLFSGDHKKDIPFMPTKIGVVTSPTGAAIRDIINVIKRRFPPATIIVYPSLVQGDLAPENIIKGLLYFDQREDIDLIITGRGGGAFEELFAFNDEDLARVIYGLDKPIISAVGHETDFSISDFVADLRAPTPSAAAELSVPDVESLLDYLDLTLDSLIKSYNRNLKDYKSDLSLHKRSLDFYNPVNSLREKRQDLDIIFKDLVYKYEKSIGNRKINLTDINNRLRILDPQLGLDKGLGILLNDEGKMIRSIDQMNLGDRVTLVLHDGRASSLVQSIEREDKS